MIANIFPISFSKINTYLPESIEMNLYYKYKRSPEYFQFGKTKLERCSCSYGNISPSNDNRNVHMLLRVFCLLTYIACLICNRANPHSAVLRPSIVKFRSTFMSNVQQTW